MPRNAHDLSGQRFGSLVALEMLPREKNAIGKLMPVRWRCKCDCGNIIEVIAGRLTAGSRVRCDYCIKNKKAAPVSAKCKYPCPWPSSACEGQEKFGICCYDCQNIDCDNYCKNNRKVCISYCVRHRKKVEK